MDDGTRSKVALQFRSEGLDVKGGGKQPHLSAKKKHDRFMLSLHGLDMVDFMGKNPSQCIESMKIGVMADDGGAVDHTYCSVMMYD